jgi:mercuric ion transport protein
MRSGAGIWTLLTTGGGIASSFGAAACCALPLMLASAGVSSAALGGLAPIVGPYRTILLAAASVLLVSTAVMLAVQFRRASACPVDADCASPARRYLTLAGLLLGTALLAAAFVYD